MQKPLFIILAASLLSLAGVSSARADVAPTGSYTVTTCEGDDKAKCTACDLPLWQNGDYNLYNTCAAAATAKGLTKDACSEYHGGGGSQTYYYCPAGVKLAETTTTQGGGCSMGGDPGGALLGLLGLGFLAGAVARRRRAR